jgi:signal recognition particle subunit SRP54
MNKIKDVDIDERELVKVEAVINSMTKRERKDHSLINGQRRKRIALGSGTTVADVNRVIKQYVEIKKMLKMFKGKKGFKLPKFMPF